MNRNTKKKILVFLSFVGVCLVLTGIVLLRNYYGRTERVRTYLTEKSPQLKRLEKWHIEQYKEKKHTEWRKRSFETSGVIKGDCRVFVLKNIYESKKTDSIFSFNTYDFETFKEMESGIPFEVDFNNRFDDYSRISLAAIPDLFLEEDLKEYYKKGLITVDGEFREDSLDQTKYIERMVEEINLKLDNCQEILNEYETYFGNNPDYVDQNHVREIIVEAKEKKKRLEGFDLVLNTITALCQKKDNLSGYVQKAVSYSNRSRELVLKADEFIKFLDGRPPYPEQEQISASALVWCEQNAPDLYDRYLAASNAIQNSRSYNQKLEAIRTYNSVCITIRREEGKPPEDDDGKGGNGRTSNPLNPEPQVAQLDEQIVLWCKANRPDLYDCYYAALVEARQQDLSEDKKAKAIIAYNKVCDEILLEMSLPVLDKLDAEAAEWCKLNSAELYEQYEAARNAAQKNDRTQTQRIEAINECNAICRTLREKYGKYIDDPQPAKNLDEDTLEFAEEYFPDLFEEYSSAKRTISTNSLYLLRAKETKASQAEIDRYQTRINDATIRFNSARQRILLEYNRR